MHGSNGGDSRGGGDGGDGGDGGGGREGGDGVDGGGCEDGGDGCRVPMRSYNLCSDCLPKLF